MEDSEMSVKSAVLTGILQPPIYFSVDAHTDARNAIRCSQMNCARRILAAFAGMASARRSGIAIGGTPHGYPEARAVE